MPVARFPQKLQVHGVVHAHVSRTLHERLDDDGRGLVRMSGECGLHLREFAP